MGHQIGCDTEVLQKSPGVDMNPKTWLCTFIQDHRLLAICGWWVVTVKKKIFYSLLKVCGIT